MVAQVVWYTFLFLNLKLEAADCGSACATLIEVVMEDGIGGGRLADK